MTSPIPETQYVPASPSMLASRTSEAIGRNPDRRTGVVAGFDNGILTITVSGGATERVGYLSSYEPAVGDIVCLIQQRSTWLCIGRLSAASDPALPPGAMLGGVLFVSGGTTVLNSGTEAVITGYQFTVELPSDHLIQIRGLYALDNNTNDADFPFMRIRENNVSGTVVYGAYSPINQGHVGTVQRVEHWFRTGPLVTTKTYVMTGQRLFGAAVFNVSRFGLFGAFDHGRATNVITL